MRILNILRFRRVQFVGAVFTRGVNIVHLIIKIVNRFVLAHRIVLPLAASPEQVLWRFCEALARRDVPEDDLWIFRHNCDLS